MRSRNSSNPKTLGQTNPIASPIVTQPNEPPVFKPNTSDEPMARAPQPRGQNSGRFQDSALVQNKLAVLAVMFLVTGFLGLPLLWLCKKFSNAERWTWAVINTIYTCALIWVVVQVCLWSWGRISASF